MEGRKPASAEATTELSYFDIQAYWGVTKHMGGLRATDALTELCHIDEDKYVLEVGCGVGLTSCYLAQKYGCWVMGVDISEKMVEWARRRAVRRRVEDRVEFRVADAQALPFEDALFDVVIGESVTAFPEDKRRAVSEYVRVTKPGGYVGLNEGTWLETPPADLVEYVKRTMAGAEFLTPDGWTELLAGAGLSDIVARTYKVGALRQRLDEMSGLDFDDLLDRLRAWGTFFSLYLKNPAFRRYAREITPSAKIIRDLFTYLGYGIYVGVKREA
ncbi:MAG: methyltransferase domain-containing protein [Chloroflexi bacterium]|nr:methyltransferase domain-containing protein [Chloroflexota bacterium]